MIMNKISSSFQHQALTQNYRVKIMLNHSKPLTSQIGILSFFRTFCGSINKRQKPNCYVYVSNSNCIFENLALEDWLYMNSPLAENDYLLLWRNKPAIVMGRHQNPWLEANLKLAREKDIVVARRASGGGTVYHDMGNLNLSFLTARNRYNRRRNLELVVSALKNYGDIDLTINHKDDILLDKFYKLSGTASKLGRVQSYHHFTLLHSLDLSILPKLLENQATGVTSKATQSIPSLVKNLVEDLPHLTVDDMIAAVSQEFLKHTETTGLHHKVVDPTDNSRFPGVEKHKQELTEWSWIFGKTPKFSVEREFTGHEFHEKLCNVQISMTMEKGKISEFNISDPSQVLEGLVPLTVAFFKEHIVGDELIPENLSRVNTDFLNFCDSAFMDRSSEVHKAATWLNSRVQSCLQFV